MTPRHLADLLADDSARGVRRWLRPPPMEQLELDADASGWRILLLDSTEAATRTDFLQVCAASFALPDWFGMNWDALEECLVDLDLTEVPEGGGVAVAWAGWADLARAEPADFVTALAVFASAVGQWEQAGVPGVVLLLGEGPDVDLAPIDPWRPGSDAGTGDPA